MTRIHKADAQHAARVAVAALIHASELRRQARNRERVRIARMLERRLGLGDTRGLWEGG